MRNKTPWPADGEGYVKVEVFKLADGSATARLTREDGTQWVGKPMSAADVQIAEAWCEENKVEFEACRNT